MYSRSNETTYAHGEKLTLAYAEFMPRQFIASYDFAFIVKLLMSKQLP
jgi:hypothetical protein